MEDKVSSQAELALTVFTVNFKSIPPTFPYPNVIENGVVGMVKDGLQPLFAL